MVYYDESTLWALTKNLAAACREVSSVESSYCIGLNCDICPLQIAKDQVTKMGRQLSVDQELEKND
jgi:hypothetical protein